MPHLHWKSDETATDPDQVVVAFASAFVAPRWRDLIAVMRWVPSIARQLRHSDGLIEYRLSARVLTRRLTTVSVWRDHASMAAFVTAEPHRTAMIGLAGRLGTPAFATVELPASSVRLDADMLLSLHGVAS